MKKTYCDDWDCPAHVSCAHHFGRQKEYVSMIEPSKRTFTLRSFGREAGDEACGQYKLDEPKSWLLAMGLGK